MKSVPNLDEAEAGAESDWRLKKSDKSAIFLRGESDFFFSYILMLISPVLGLVMGGVIHQIKGE